MENLSRFIGKPIGDELFAVLYSKFDPESQIITNYGQKNGKIFTQENYCEIMKKFATSRRDFLFSLMTSAKKESPFGDDEIDHRHFMSGLAHIDLPDEHKMPDHLSELHKMTEKFFDKCSPGTSGPFHHGLIPRELISHEMGRPTFHEMERLKSDKLEQKALMSHTESESGQTRYMKRFPQTPKKYSKKLYKAMFKINSELAIKYDIPDVVCDLFNTELQVSNYKDIYKFTSEYLEYKQLIQDYIMYVFSIEMGKPVTYCFLAPKTASEAPKVAPEATSAAAPEA